MGRFSMVRSRTEVVASPAKVEANRKNALKSTGPKTVQGKRTVRWNAVKHGLLSKEVVISAGDGKENAGQYRNLLSELILTLGPVGILEEMLVERIAVCYWRLGRALRCETGEIRKRLDCVAWESASRWADEIRHDIRFSTLDDSKARLQRSSLGIQFLLNRLKDLRAEVEQEGFLTELGKETLLKMYSPQTDGFATTLLVINELTIGALPVDGDVSADSGELPEDTEAHRKAMLDTIDTEMERLKGLEDHAGYAEDLRYESEVMRYHLPTSESSDKILRYETTIERQLYRAINQLERLQRQREGESVPPPIQIDLSGKD
jgi:hypothetical protein